MTCPGQDGMSFDTDRGKGGPLGMGTGLAVPFLPLNDTVQ